MLEQSLEIKKTLKHDDSNVVDSDEEENFTTTLSAVKNNNEPSDFMINLKNVIHDR